MVLTDNLAPGQFGINIIQRTIWHQIFMNIFHQNCHQKNVTVVLIGKPFKESPIKSYFFCSSPQQAGYDE